MKKFLVSAVPALAAVSLISTMPGEADAAASRTMHALTCYVASGSVVVNSAGQVANTSAGSVVLNCPVISDTGTALASLVDFRTAGVTLKIDGYSNGSGWKAKACRTLQSGGAPGGFCGAEFSTNSAGLVSAQSLDMSAWSGVSAEDFAYVQVTLGPISAGSSNVVWGSHMAKP